MIDIIGQLVAASQTKTTSQFVSAETALYTRNSIQPMRAFASGIKPIVLPITLWLILVILIFLTLTILCDDSECSLWHARQTEAIA